MVLPQRAVPVIATLVMCSSPGSSQSRLISSKGVASPRASSLNSSTAVDIVDFTPAFCSSTSSVNSRSSSFSAPPGSSSSSPGSSHVRRPARCPPRSISVSPEAMRHGGDPVLLQHGVERLVRQGSAARAGEHERAVAIAQRPRRAENLHRTPAERDPVLPFRLHPRRRDGPHVVGQVHLGPQRPAVSTRNSNASLRAGIARDPRTAATAAATSRCGSARIC